MCRVKAMPGAGSRAQPALGMTGELFSESIWGLRWRREGISRCPSRALSLQEGLRCPPWDSGPCRARRALWLQRPGRGPLAESDLSRLLQPHLSISDEHPPDHTVGRGREVKQTPSDPTIGKSRDSLGHTHLDDSIIVINQCVSHLHMVLLHHLLQHHAEGPNEPVNGRGTSWSQTKRPE